MFKHFKNDFPASIVVFLVAVPLCLGIALASGAPLFSGIIAGIIGGIVVGGLSGSNLGVSGPAAGLAVIVLNAIQDIGSFQVFLSAVVLAGVFQVALGYLRAGIIAYYFPNSVIKGMLAGIGIVIFFKQIPHAFGYDKDYEGEMEFMQPDGETTTSELLNMLDYISPGATLIAAVSLAILIIWEQNFIKKQTWSNLIQGPLVAVTVGILYFTFTKGSAWGIEKEHLVSLPISSGVSEFFGQFMLPDFSRVFTWPIIKVAGIIALVASLETLLCVEATDKLDPDKAVTPTNRELKAQGVGNILAGLVGGIPVTQVIVRSSANIQSGGKTKLSAILHGVLILICVAFLPQILNMIPKATLAAILLVVGYKLANPKTMKAMYQKGWLQFVPYAATILGLFFIDLLWGVGIGLFLGVLIILYYNFRTPFYIHEEDWQIDKPIKIQLAQEVSFLNKAGVQQTLSHIPNNREVVIDATKSVIIDPDVVELILDFKLSAKSKNIKVTLLGLEEKVGKDAVRHFREAMKD